MSRPSSVPSEPEHSLERDRLDPQGDLVLSEGLCLALSQMFRALADPSRARIVASLLHADLTTSELADRLGLSLPGVSQHLRLLRALRIVKPRREGRLVHYSLDDAHIRLLVTLSISHLKETLGAREQPDSVFTNQPPMVARTRPQADG